MCSKPLSLSILLVLAFTGAAPFLRATPSVRATFAGSGDLRLESAGQAFSAMRSEEMELRTHCEELKIGSASVEIGVVFQRIDFNQGGKPWSLPLPKRFQSAGLDLTFTDQLAPGWHGMVQISPTWRTAGGSRLVAKSFGATASMLAIREFSRGLRLAMGASADTLAAGDSRFLPVAGVDWEFASKWRLSLGLPRTGVFFNPVSTLELGLAVTGTWATYYVAASGPVEILSVDARLTETKLEYREARTGLQVKWQARANFELSATIGVVGHREFDYPDRRRKLKSDSTGGYASVELGFTF